jgi:hypothetical protein
MFAMIVDLVTAHLEMPRPRQSTGTTLQILLAENAVVFLLGIRK